jgi:fumarylacetoacetate (FAA) hydrolase
MSFWSADVNLLRSQAPDVRLGDRVRIEVLDGDGETLFGAIDQRIVAAGSATAR